MRKQSIFGFLLGIVFALTIAAQATNLMTVRPAKPTATKAATLYQQDAAKWIEARAKEGYQVQSITKTSGGMSDHGFVLIVLVKY